MRSSNPPIFTDALAVLREALPRMIRRIHRPRVYSHQEIERLLSMGATAGKPRVFLMTVLDFIKIIATGAIFTDRSTENHFTSAGVMAPPDPGCRPA